jgi:predicted component of type VI protein secretion system
MDGKQQVEVINASGWRKSYVLQQPITHIGSSAENEIVLQPGPGDEIEARHLQVIQMGETYNLINLSEQDVVIGGSNGNLIAPLASAPIKSGSQVRLGQFTLLFSAEKKGAETLLAPAAGSVPFQVEHQSPLIGLKLRFYEASLSPDRPLDGGVIVSHQGEKPEVQFKLEVEGLPPSCYYLEPAPLLPAHVQEEILLRLFHPHEPSPAAGQHRLSLRATAPIDYPGEYTLISMMIDLLPFYDYEVEVQF